MLTPVVRADTAYRAAPRAFDTAAAESPGSTRWPFFALCCYLLAQAYMIPLFPVGPSWSLWPRLADFAAALLLLTVLLQRRSAARVSPANAFLFRFLLFILAGWTVAFLFHLLLAADWASDSVVVGAYYIYRLAQFICIYWAVARIPLSATRITILRRLVDAVLIFVVAGIVLTYLKIVPLSTLTAHLPQGLGAAGPWSFFAILAGYDLGAGWGTISYNHAYVALQVFMLVALRIYLTPGRNEASNQVVLGLGLVGCFLSESRAGLLSMVLFAMIYWLRKPLYLTLLALAAMALAVAQPLIEASAASPYLQATLERQQTLLAANEAENLAGRDYLWASYLGYLNEEPLRWVFGAGFGVSLDDLGNHAHQLYLTIIADSGLFGLIIFAFLFAKILLALWQHEPQGKPLFWATAILLLSSLTQENFYPDVALGHFLGLYLCALAIALRVQHDPQAAPLRTPSPQRTTLVSVPRPLQLGAFRAWIAAGLESASLARRELVELLIDRVLVDTPVGGIRYVTPFGAPHSARWHDDYTIKPKPTEADFKVGKQCRGWEGVQVCKLDTVRTLVALGWMAAGLLDTLGVAPGRPEARLLAHLGKWNRGPTAQQAASRSRMACSTSSPSGDGGSDGAGAAVSRFHRGGHP